MLPFCGERADPVVVSRPNEVSWRHGQPVDVPACRRNDLDTSVQVSGPEKANQQPDKALPYGV